jgi:hypothetical protein
MRTLNLRFTFAALGLVLFACPAAFGQNPLAPTEPIVVDTDRAYPTTVSPPGSPFVPVSYDTSSIINQLAHSSTGIVQLAPGDYSVPVRIYCTNVHATGTQHGLAYRMAPLEGKRAPLLIALESRAAAARPPFQQLQQLIWQIMGGLSYSEMPPQSQSLVDQLIPEYRNQLNEDFVTALQKRLNLLQRIPATAGLATDVEVLIQRYQVIHNTLMQDANNFDALEHELVNIIPGTAQNAGPSSWSQVSSRVYAKLADGNVYGQLGHLQIRVLPRSTPATNASVSAGRFLTVNYTATKPRSPAVTDNDQADVPMEAMIAYPNASTMQGLTTIIDSGGMGSNPVITSVSSIQPICQQKIAIIGKGFGEQSPFDGDTPDFQIRDVTGNWSAGYKAPRALSGDAVTIDVTSWTDTEIDVSGFGGAYGVPSPSSLSLHSGDQIRFEVWNAQAANSAVGQSATYVSSVSGSGTSSPPATALNQQVSAAVSNIQTSLLDSAATAVSRAQSLPPNTKQALVDACISTFPAVAALTVNALTNGSGSFACQNQNVLAFDYVLACNGTAIVSALGKDLGPLPDMAIQSQLDCQGLSIPGPQDLVLDALGLQWFSGIIQADFECFLGGVQQQTGGSSFWSSYSPCMTAAANKYTSEIWSDLQASIAADAYRRGQELGQWLNQFVSACGTPTQSISASLPSALRLGSPTTSSTKSSISGVSPTTGAVGTIVTIRGTGFISVTRVTFGGTSAEFSTTSQTTINATVPDISSEDKTFASLGSPLTVGVTVTVTTASGSANSLFNYAGPK